MSFTALAGERVVVRRFRPEDVAEFVAYRSDAEVARYQSWDVPYSPEEGERGKPAQDEITCRRRSCAMPVKPALSG